ncbi:class I SAM-dependent methyltransferase [Spiractinospora alimapuensis]|uniref:class I SAM-dependent methyltransferase n=1 Tax=Spiractinospora alimapuensis TaxID=2820884 RepID=UPI001F4545B0|nr:class I SAM-dependent methyltransferase [Spiractinospora alimapuensis]QVQ51370.1 class I SAM-dependent methyltransferase [Spiractinospora alimapuensis]
MNAENNTPVRNEASAEGGVTGEGAALTPTHSGRADDDTRWSGSGGHVTHEFDKNYWEDHWTPTVGGDGRLLPVNPYVPAETAHLPRGTALDAGCGTGTEALWLAERGWRVTGADISANALATAAGRADAAGLAGQVEWVETDVTRWKPERAWDLVVTSYAHPDIGQLAFYRRIAAWVAPGGTLLIVGHVHDHGQHDHGHHGHGQHGHGHGHGHPEGATATRAGIAELFPSPEWRVDAAYENTRTVHAGGRARQLRDVVVRVQRVP